MKILFNAIRGSDAAGCQRIIFPLYALNKNKKIEIDVLNTLRLEEQLKWADLVVLQCLIGDQPFQLIEHIKKVGKKIVIDYDDDFSNLPSNALKLLNFTQEQAAENWYKYLKLGDLITVTTSILADVVRPINNNVKVLPNYIRHSDYVESLSYNPWDSNDFKIMYSCSESHLEDIKYISPVLSMTSTLFPKITIVSHGGLDFTFLNPKFGGKAEHYDKVPYESYIKYLRSVKPHVFIGPLLNSQLNQSRSNLKYLQSSLLKCVFICNDLVPYANVKHGVTGFKTNNRLSWIWYLRKLINNKALLINMGQNAFQDAGKYILEDHIDLWYEVYKKLLETDVRKN